MDRFLVRLGGSTTTGRALLFEFLVVVGLVLAGAAAATADAIVLRFEVVQHGLGVLERQKHRQCPPIPVIPPSEVQVKSQYRGMGKGRGRRTWRVSFVNDLLCAAAL